MRRQLSQHGRTAASTGESGHSRPSGRVATRWSPWSGKHLGGLREFPDATRDADLIDRKSRAGGRALTAVLRDLGFEISSDLASETERGNAFMQVKNGPFDADPVFAPDGIERFEDGWRRGSSVAGFRVC